MRAHQDLGAVLLLSRAIALVAVSLGACDGGPAGQEPDGGPGPDGGEVTRSVCTPQPVTRASDLAPDLLERVLAAEAGDCHLVSRTTSGDAPSFPSSFEAVPVGTKDCAGDECWVALPAFTYRWDHRVEPDGDYWLDVTSHFVGVAQPSRNPVTGAVRVLLDVMAYSSSAVRRFERIYDASGHLLLERERWDGGVWFATENTWSGDSW